MLVDHHRARQGAQRCIEAIEAAAFALGRAQYQPMTLQPIDRQRLNADEFGKRAALLWETRAGNSKP